MKFFGDPAKATATTPSARRDHKYKYTAINGLGEQVKGEESAVSATVVHSRLFASGLEPVTVKVKTDLFNYDVTQGKVSKRAVANFSRQLAVFVKADVPLTDALEVIGKETENNILRGIIFEMVDGIRGGRSVADVAEEHPHAFPPFYVGILRSAEMTGELDTVLFQLSHYMDSENDALKKLKSAMVYPAVVISTAIVTVAVSMVFVLPSLLSFFTTLHAKVPIPTRVLMWLASAAKASWMELVGLVVVTAVVIGVMARYQRGVDALNRTILKLPVVGDIVRTAIMERILRVLAATLSAGVDLPSAMNVAAAAASNVVYRDGITAVREAMMSGQGITDPLIRTGLFPGTATQMFRVGEETGTLDEQLQVAAEYQKQELETKITRAMAALEPVLMIGIGTVVIFISVALISAMYGVYSQVHVH
jgi:type IV pilus assembly protein PilC